MLTLSTDQEDAVLLLISGLRVPEDHRLVPVIFDLRDQLITRHQTRAWSAMLLKEVTE